MSDSDTVAMSAAEITAFVREHRTCVLALPSAEHPYAIPVSYAFEEPDEFYLRLVAVEESAKHDHLEERVPARLVIHEVDDPTSVIADGRLVSLDPAELSPEEIRTLGGGETPAFELWPVDKAELDVTIYRLVDAELTGRRPRRDDD